MDIELGMRNVREGERKRVSALDHKMHSYALVASNYIIVNFVVVGGRFCSISIMKHNYVKLVLYVQSIFIRIIYKYKRHLF